MRTLVIETATPACSVALFEGEQLIAHDHRELGRGHAERLVPMISDLPDKGKAAHILVSLGPGSFTGVRIGLATARALGFAWGAEVLGYPTLALVAAMAQSQGAGEVTVAMTGGHGEWFVADFGSDNAPIGPMRSLIPSQAAARGAKPALAGSEAAALGELLEGDHHQSEATLPDARAAILLPQSILSLSLSPIYGRVPDAKPQAEGLAH